MMMWRKKGFLSIFPRTILSYSRSRRLLSRHRGDGENGKKGLGKIVVNKVSKFHHDYPLASNCIVYGGITGFTEFTQQTVQYKLVPYWKEQEVKNYDKSSLMRYTSLGCVVFAPVLHYWYRFLDTKYPANTTKVVMKKVGLDLVVLGAPLYAAFYAFICALEGYKAQDIIKELKSKLLATLAAGAVFWIPAQTVNFRYVPPTGRILYISVCTFVEVNILSVLKKMDFGD
eukprot:TRINITY_DN4813_c0_g1_i4.p1 TRINITY_DN4813_c0_g1~~TRINITY_DN4813_c0_g1_i4.p1  ORF type:complete len:229 (+),score=24.83 TRINITY_DN4813_c0_g1_i4:98-784(+)